MSIQGHTVAKLVLLCELHLATCRRKQNNNGINKREIYFSCKRILEAAVHTDPGLLTSAVYQSSAFRLEYLSGFHHGDCSWSKTDSEALPWTSHYISISDGRQEKRRKGSEVPSSCAGST